MPPLQVPATVYRSPPWLPRTLTRATGDVGDPADQPWGVRQAKVVDPGGQHWVLTQHLRDTDPAEWFGQVFEPLLG